jgi:hypothetical protein
MRPRGSGSRYNDRSAGGRVEGGRAVRAASVSNTRAPWEEIFTDSIGCPAYVPSGSGGSLICSGGCGSISRVCRHGYDMNVSAVRAGVTNASERQRSPSRIVERGRAAPRCRVSHRIAGIRHGDAFECLKASRRAQAVDLARVAASESIEE